MLPIQKLLINYNHSARSEKVKYIIIHDVGGISTARNNRDYFSGGNRNASADFFVDSTNIIQAIDYHTRYSWAVGDGGGKYEKTNRNTVNIEMCLESNWQPSEQTVQNTLDLVKYLMNELNISIENVQRHYDCSRKACPKCFSTNNWAKWYEFKARLGGTSIPTQHSTDPTPIQSPLYFSYPNNAKVVNTDLYVRDVNGVVQAGRYVSNGDNVTVLDVSGSKQIVLVEYPTQSGVKTGYISNTSNIIYTYQSQYHNGSTSEIVYDENGSIFGSLDARESATPLYRKNGKLHVVYNIAGHVNGKSGYVIYNGGFSKF